MTEFLNPYTFVRATTRSKEGELGDGEPPGHDRLIADRYTGKLTVRMEVVTPLLVLDDALATTDNQGHTTYGIRKDSQGKPLIPPSAVKGMLRSAYEAITNSRFGVFQGHEKKHHEALDETLRPAVAATEMSPAERVFGWAAPSGPGAWRGSVSVARVHPGTECKITSDGMPRILTLGAPSPSQALFYVGTKEGKPLPDRHPMGRAYQKNDQRLRGRKVYLHHVEFEAKTEPKAKMSNRSITEWIEPKPESTFSFELRVLNLSKVEIGALLWILALPDEAHHKLGYGKPLGYGSMKVSIDPNESELLLGSEWASRWKQMTPVKSPLAPFDASVRGDLVEAFQKAATGDINDTLDVKDVFEHLDHISDFLSAARGGKNIMYPPDEAKGQALPQAGSTMSIPTSRRPGT